MKEKRKSKSGSSETNPLSNPSVDPSRIAPTLGPIHAENLGGDIEKALNQRCVIGAFPWRYDGLESCPCRIVCFFDVGEDVEAVGDAAKALSR